MKTFTFGIVSFILFLSPFYLFAQYDTDLIVAPHSEITYHISTKSNQQLNLYARVRAVTNGKQSSRFKLSTRLPILLSTSNIIIGESKKIQPSISFSWIPTKRVGRYRGIGYIKMSQIATNESQLHSKSIHVKLNYSGKELQLDMIQPEEGIIEVTVGNTGKVPMQVSGLHMQARSISKTIKRSGNEIANFTLPEGQPDGECSSWWQACNCWTSCDPYNTGGTFGIPVIVVGSAGTGSEGSGSSNGTGGTGSNGNNPGGGAGGGDNNGGPSGDNGSGIDDVPEKREKSFIARKFKCSSSVPLYVNVGNSAASQKLGYYITGDGTYQNASGTESLAYASVSAIQTGDQAENLGGEG